MCFCVHAESIVEAALCKSVLKPLREPIYQRLEKLHTNSGSLKQLAQNQVRHIRVESESKLLRTLQLWSILLELLHTHASNNSWEADAVCMLCQSVVLGSTTTALGITTAVPEASTMEKISIKFSNLHLEYSPQKKIELLLKSCKIIYDSMSVSCPGQNPYLSYPLGLLQISRLLWFSPDIIGSLLFYSEHRI